MSERNFFAELKRRNVYKAAVAYVVVAWLVIHAASILLPTFDAPPLVMKVVVFLVVLGFPATLIFSWAFEITPEGIKRESEVEQGKSIAHHTGPLLDPLRSDPRLEALAEKIILARDFKGPNAVK